jgi:hypothetical protein
MLNSTVYFNLITKDYSRSLANAATDPTVARENTYYLNNIGKVTSIDQFLNNSQLYTYAMKAYGLGGMLNEKGLVRQVLEQGVSSSTALANTLSNPNFKALATALNFQANGTSATSKAAATTGTVAAYNQQALDTQVGQQSTGAKMALYFQQNVGKITSTYNILGDVTLLNVVESALGLSTSISGEDIDTQAKLLDTAMTNAGMTISNLQNPTKLAQFLQRFTANYDANNPSSASTTPTSALDVTTPGISSDLLLSLANLKLGGS